MTVNIKELEISKVALNKQRIQKCEENTELSETLKKEINSGNEIQTLSKVNQDERTSLNKLRKISETVSVNENYKLICSNQTISCLKGDSEILQYRRKALKCKLYREMRTSM